MAAAKAGDRVKIVTRDLTSDDAKTGLYYEYFGGLVGTVDRIYDDGSVCLDVDIDSLSEDTRKRHQAMQENERKRWLESLSDEARNRLTAEQKQLKISYKILVSNKDIAPYKGGTPKDTPVSKVKASKADSSAPKDDSAGETSSEEAANTASSESQKAEKEAEVAETQPKRLSEADLAAAEEAFLKSRLSSTE